MSESFIQETREEKIIDALEDIAIAIVDLDDMLVAGVRLT